MINKRDIVIFGDDWGRYPSTIQHIGKTLATQNRIIWVGSLGLRKPKLSVYDVKRVWEKTKAIFQKSTHDSSQDNSVYQVYPFILPLHDNPFIYKLNMVFLRTTIRKKMATLKFKNPIILTASPIVEGVIGTLGESSSHYFCLDDFTLFDDAFSSIGKLEKKLLSKVDSCFSISESLMKSRKVSTKHNYFLPQGVNTDHFAPSGHEIIPEVATLKHPIIGFFGILTTWVDIELIYLCALRYPQYTFLILGKAAVDISVLSKAKNILFLGEISFLELPKYARAFDVGLIPFVVNDLTVACNPLKLLEYLSLGIPVVSTKLPEVKKMEHHVIIAESREDFIAGIEKAVLQVTTDNNRNRRMFAEKYSWISIAENISEKIEKIENEKSNEVNF